MPSLLIVGCGALGNRLGRVMVAAGWVVYGLRRNIAAVDPLIRSIAADLSLPDGLPQLPAVDAVVYTVTPSGRGAQAYHQAYVLSLQRILSALPTPAPRMIYVSSTGVLADSAGAWVDENTTVYATSENARILRAAEEIALAHDSVVLRLAGIYGGERRWLLRQASDENLVCSPEPEQWTNRIHEYDCVMALQHLLLLRDAVGVYHAVDDLPVPRYEVLAWLREQLHLPPPRAMASVSLSSDEQALLASGKRISNQRLRATGWTPHYPNYRAGYRRMLAAE